MFNDQLGIDTKIIIIYKYFVSIINFVFLSTYIILTSAKCHQNIFHKHFFV